MDKMVKKLLIASLIVLFFSIIVENVFKIG